MSTAIYDEEGNQRQIRLIAELNRLLNEERELRYQVQERLSEREGVVEQDLVLFRDVQQEAKLDRELRQHLEDRISVLATLGDRAEQARRKALKSVFRETASVDDSTLATAIGGGGDVFGETSFLSNYVGGSKTTGGGAAGNSFVSAAGGVVVPGGSTNSPYNTTVTPTPLEKLEKCLTSAEECFAVLSDVNILRTNKVYEEELAKVKKEGRQLLRQCQDVMAHINDLGKALVQEREQAKRERAVSLTNSRASSGNHGAEKNNFQRPFRAGGTPTSKTRNFAVGSRSSSTGGGGSPGGRRVVGGAAGAPPPAATSSKIKVSCFGKRPFWEGEFVSMNESLQNFSAGISSFAETLHFTDRVLKSTSRQHMDLVRKMIVQANNSSSRAASKRTTAIGGGGGSKATAATAEQLSPIDAAEAERQINISTHQAHRRAAEFLRQPDVSRGQLSTAVTAWGSPSKKSKEQAGSFGLVHPQSNFRTSGAPPPKLAVKKLNLVPATTGVTASISNQYNQQHNDTPVSTPGADTKHMSSGPATSPLQQMVVQLNDFSQWSKTSKLHNDNPHENGMPEEQLAGGAVDVKIQSSATNVVVAGGASPAAGLRRMVGGGTSGAAGGGAANVAATTTTSSSKMAAAQHNTQRQTLHSLAAPHLASGGTELLETDPKRGIRNTTLSKPEGGSAHSPLGTTAALARHNLPGAGGMTTSTSQQEQETSRVVLPGSTTSNNSNVPLYYAEYHHNARKQAAAGGYALVPVRTLTPTGSKTPPAAAAAAGGGVAAPALGNKPVTPAVSAKLMANSPLGGTATRPTIQSQLQSNVANFNIFTPLDEGGGGNYVLNKPHQEGPLSACGVVDEDLDWLYPKPRNSTTSPSAQQKNNSRSGSHSASAAALSGAVRSRGGSSSSSHSLYLVNRSGNHGSATTPGGVGTAVEQRNGVPAFDPRGAYNYLEKNSNALGDLRDEQSGMTRDRNQIPNATASASSAKMNMNHSTFTIEDLLVEDDHFIRKTPDQTRGGLGAAANRKVFPRGSPEKSAGKLNDENPSCTAVVGTLNPTASGSQVGVEEVGESKVIRDFAETFNLDINEASPPKSLNHPEEKL